MPEIGDMDPAEITAIILCQNVSTHDPDSIDIKQMDS